METLLSIVRTGFTIIVILFLASVVVYFIGTRGNGRLAVRLRPLAERIGDLAARIFHGKGEGGS